MVTSEALLVSSDRPLVEAVQGVVRSVRDLRLRVTDDPEAAALPPTGVAVAHAAAAAAGPAPPPYPAEGGTLAQAKGEAEAQRIAQALQKHKNNRLRAAAELGVSPMTLYQKLRRYGLMLAN
jgi:DNA-binding NtrC family response regulator